MDPALAFITGALDKGGPALLAIVFAVLYFQEKAERKAMTTMFIDLNPKILVTLNEIRSILSATGGRGVNGGGK